VKSYGKCHLEDIEPTVNASESFANWCTVDTRTGRLACVLEENYCFDAETYADELDLEETIDFREDQRSRFHRY
jgi:WD repeat-containing protein 48